MLKLLALLFLAAVLSACALAPNTVDVHAEHISHATQHAPFTDAPTRYYVNMIGVSARWGKRTGPYVELGENVILDPCRRIGSANERQCGGLMGPRETFEGRIGYVWQVK